MPFIATRVIRAVDDPKTTGNVLAAIIETDPGITAWVMRVTNSAAYGRQRKVTSLPQAVTLLGFNELKNLVISASVRALYRTFGPVEKELWLHSVAAGIASRLIAREAAKTMAAKTLREAAFLAGQMHDVGRLIIRTKMPQEYNAIEERSVELGGVGAEEEVLGYAHTDVGSLIMQRWNMPNVIEAAAFYHHDLEMCEMLAAEHVSLVACVILADELAHRQGIGGPPNPLDNLSVPRALELLGINDERFDSLSAPFAEAFAAERAAI